MQFPVCEHQNVPSAKFCAVCRAEAGPTRQSLRCVWHGPRCHDSDGSGPLTELLRLCTQFTACQVELWPSFRDQLRTPKEGHSRFVTVPFTDVSRAVPTVEQQLHPEYAAILVNGLLNTMVGLVALLKERVRNFLGGGVLVLPLVQAARADAHPSRTIPPQPGLLL